MKLTIKISRQKIEDKINLKKDDIKENPIKTSNISPILKQNEDILSVFEKEKIFMDSSKEKNIILKHPKKIKDVYMEESKPRKRIHEYPESVKKFMNIEKSGLFSFFKNMF